MSTSTETGAGETARTRAVDAHEAAEARPLWQVVLIRPEVMTLVLLIAAFFIASALSPFFADATFILESASFYVEYAIVALVLTLVIISGEIDLSPAAVDAKLIGSSRGGYCYEHNSLFARVLTAIGFEVELLLGRVHWLQPPGDPPRARTHMALRVTIDGVPWLADVGFGGAVATSPLRMDHAEPQPTAHEAFRLIPFGAGLLVQSRYDGRWHALYELSLEPQLAVDVELPNWFMATHPSSHFRHRLIVSRATPEARHRLLNGRLTVRTPDGRVERRALDADQIEQALGTVFALPVEAAWRPLLERAAAATAEELRGA